MAAKAPKKTTTAEKKTATSTKIAAKSAAAKTPAKTTAKPLAKKAPTKGSKPAKQPVKATAKSAKRSASKAKTATIKTVKAAVKPAKSSPHAGFVDFLREQSVVGLAIGLIIGAQTKSLADQLIASFINPLLGLLMPGKGALDQQTFVLHLNDKSATFAWGSFIAVLLSFMTTAAVVYFVFKFLKLDRLTKKKEAEA
jgi:large conductance mechanosensitive channel